MTKKSKLRQNLFDFIFVFWVVYYLLFNLSTFGKLFGDTSMLNVCVTAIVFAGTFVVQLLSKFRKRDFIITILLIFLGVINSFCTKDKTGLMPFLFWSAARSVDITITTKKVFRATVVSCIFVILLSLSGLIQNKTSAGYLLWDNRIYLGFSHPNFCGAIFLDLILLLIFNRKGNLRFPDYLFILCIELLNLYGPKSKTSLILGAIAAFFVLFINKASNGMIKWILSKAKYLPIFLAGLSVLVVYLYYMNTTWAALLNTFLSTRIEQMEYFWSHYKITLFGQVLENVSSSQASTLQQMRGLDNGYLYMLLGKGIVFTLIFVVMSIKSIIHYIKSKEYSSVMVLTVMLIWGLMETTLFRFEMNYLLLLLSKGIFASSERIKHVEYKKEPALSNGL